MKALGLITVLSLAMCQCLAKSSKTFQFNADHNGELVEAQLLTHDDNHYTFSLDNEPVFDNVKEEISSDKSVIFWYLSKFNELSTSSKSSYSTDLERYHHVSQFRIWNSQLQNGLIDGLYLFYGKRGVLLKSVLVQHGSFSVLSGSNKPASCNKAMEQLTNNQTDNQSD